MSLKHYSAADIRTLHAKGAMAKTKVADKPTIRRKGLILLRASATPTLESDAGPRVVWRIIGPDGLAIYHE
jgi:hypothetical protein